MSYLKVINEVEWNYDLDGEGEALMFIHGWGVDRRIWRQQTKYFSPDYCMSPVECWPISCSVLYSSPEFYRYRISPFSCNIT